MYDFWMFPVTWDSWGIMQLLISMLLLGFFSTKFLDFSPNFIVLAAISFAFGAGILILTGLAMHVLRREAAFIGIDNAFVALGSIVAVALIMHFFKKWIIQIIA